MGSVDPSERGVASGMRSTLQNSGTALSIGVFFSLMIAGLASSLPAQLSSGLQAHGVPHQQAEQIAGLPPVSTLFATFLGNNPIQHLLGSSISQLSPIDSATLTGHEFFPQLVSGPFHHGLTIVFSAAALMSLVAAAASLSRGRHQRDVPPDDVATAETNLAAAERA
jgi:hypothetical protein